MRKLYIFALLVVFLTALFFNVQCSHALSTNVVISQIQLGNVASASNEFIEIYNNSATDVDITNWCLYYASASSIQNGSKLACFLSDSDSVHIYLPSHSFAFLISNQLATATPSLGSDLKFSATLSGTAGHVRLIDSGGVEVDKVGWGVTALSAEGASPATVPTVGKVLGRKTINLDVLQDTNVNSEDFEIVSPRVTYNYGSIYEKQDLCLNIADIQAVLPDGYSVDIAGNCTPPPVDICSNLDGLQATLPNGYGIDAIGDCQIDLCQNIDGLQQILPDNMELDGSGDCALHDECSNLTGVQSEIPDGYKKSDDNICLLDLLPLQISELLPNVTGSDEGKEFIEIYNPNGSDVDLENYVFYVGTNDDTFYNFPIGSHVDAGQYMAFYNDQIEFTLINTTSGVRLKSIDGVLIDETLVYNSPKDDFAWALIDGTWQYTNRPTPGGANLSSLIEVDSEVAVESSLEPCAANQYRSPETNRCRLIATTSSVLTACKDGQYRSEETNRCRSIAADVSALTPCDEGQERNPETNRCRSITAVLGDNDLTPCKEGQERNPETNRCRNIVSMPQAEYAPEQTAESSNGYVGWLALAGVGIVAIIYAIWEWRQEIAGIIRKIKLKINRKRDRLT
jgi:hypothetical protein